MMSAVTGAQRVGGHPPVDDGRDEVEGQAHDDEDHAAEARAFQDSEHKQRAEGADDLEHDGEAAVESGDTDHELEEQPSGQRLPELRAVLEDPVDPAAVGEPHDSAGDDPEQREQGSHAR